MPHILHTLHLGSYFHACRISPGKRVFFDCRFIVQDTGDFILMLNISEQILWIIVLFAPR